MSKLSHVDNSGKATMVDVSAKEKTSRIAVAQGKIFVGKEAFEHIQENKIKKGDVLSIAQISGIMGAKKTSELIPLCHNLFLSKVDVSCELDEKESAVWVKATAKTEGKTGVEMEALTAVSVACLTIYDMCKAVNKEMVISEIQLLEKSGGKSGHFKFGGEK
ncbi:MAG: cyclic pyranopterin monophosphate synthase MoaC [Calditrichaeota bacterium]|nr:MAG: cyclic pyranopterin monophosphate synthase MoaC [Calditrichota bacterium]